MPSQTRSSPFAMTRKRGPTVSSSPTPPSSSPSPVLLHAEAQSPVVKQKRSFFKRRPSKISHQKPASDPDATLSTPGIDFDESPQGSFDSPYQSFHPSGDNDSSSELVDAASSLLATLHGRIRPKSPAPLPAIVTAPTPRPSEDQLGPKSGDAQTGAARAFGFLPKLLGGSPTRDSSLAPPMLRASSSRLNLRPPPEPPSHEPAFEVRGMAFPVPPSHTQPSKLSLELSTALESPTSSISAGSTACDRPERDFNATSTPTRKSTADHELWNLGDARPSHEQRSTSNSPPSVDRTEDAMRKLTIGTDVSRSPRERIPTPHSRSFPGGVSAPLKDLPPLPVPPPPCPPPSMPLPPTPLEMQKALQEERQRAARLADELRRVKEERDALAQRLQDTQPHTHSRKGDKGAVFDYDHIIAHMVHSPTAESTFSSADEADDLFWKGSRSVTPDGDTDELFPPTPQNFSPPRLPAHAQAIPRRLIYPEHANAQRLGEPQALAPAFSQSFVELPAGNANENSSTGHGVERPAAKLSPLSAARNGARRFVRHGSSRSISSLPAPPPVAAATRSGLSRPSTAGAGSTPPVRPRRVGIVHPKQ